MKRFFTMRIWLILLTFLLAVALLLLIFLLLDRAKDQAEHNTCSYKDYAIIVA